MRESVAGGVVNRSSTETEREAAFKTLAEEQLEESYRLANAILGDLSESRDAVHDAFVRGWQRFPTLRDPSRFGDFVFAQPHGQPYAVRTVQKAWTAIAVRADVPHKPFHALRHTFATVLLSHGVDVTVVSKALGHSSIAITADVYADWTRPMQQHTAEVIASALAS